MRKHDPAFSDYPRASHLLRTTRVGKRGRRWMSWRHESRSTAHSPFVFRRRGSSKYDEMARLLELKDEEGKFPAEKFPFPFDEPVGDALHKQVAALLPGSPETRWAVVNSIYG